MYLMLDAVSLENYFLFENHILFIKCNRRIVHMGDRTCSHRQNGATSEMVAGGEGERVTVRGAIASMKFQLSGRKK